VLLADVAATSAAVAQTRGRKKKTELLAALLRTAPVTERALVARYLSGETGHKLGVGYATIGELHRSVPPSTGPRLHLAELDARFAEIAALAGTGSSTSRKDKTGALFAASTQIEQGFLAALVLGELRQGALDALVVEGIAQATELPPDRVRSAYMLAGDIGVIAEAALGEGAAGLARE